MDCICFWVQPRIILLQAIDDVLQYPLLGEYCSSSSRAATRTSFISYQFEICIDL